MCVHVYVECICDSEKPRTDNGRQGLSLKLDLGFFFFFLVKLAGQQVPRIQASLPPSWSLSVQKHAKPPGLYIDSRALNLDTHAYTAYIVFQQLSHFHNPDFTSYAAEIAHPSP